MSSVLHVSAILKVLSYRPDKTRVKSTYLSRLLSSLLLDPLLLLFPLFQVKLNFGGELFIRPEDFFDLVLVVLHELS